MAERWRMIADKEGEYHRVLISGGKKGGKKGGSTARVSRTRPAKAAEVRVKFVKQYSSPNGRVFRQYENVATGRRVDIIMRDDRNALWNYTQAEATAEAKRRLS